MKISFNVTKEFDGWSLRRFLRVKFPHLSQGLIHKSIRVKDILVNSLKISVDHLIREGDRIQIWNVLINSTQDQKSDWNFLKNCVIFENEDYWCVNKPYGLASQGGTGLKNSLDSALKSWWGNEYGNEGDLRPFLIHRLDRHTTGCILVARNYNVANELGKLFKERKVQKKYIAICIVKNFDLLKESGIELKRDDIVECEIRGEIDVDVDGKKAVSRYVIERIMKYKGEWICLINFYPVTGRKHQIRVHSQYLIGPIIGDNIKVMDGFYSEDMFKYKLCLHAKSIEFEYNGDRCFYEAEIPEHMRLLMRGMSEKYKD